MQLTSTYRETELYSHTLHYRNIMLQIIILYLYYSASHFLNFRNSTSSSRMRVMNHNWSATKQRLHLQSVAEISRRSVLSGDRIRQCGTVLMPCCRKCSERTVAKSVDSVVDTIDKLRVFAVVGLRLRHLQNAMSTSCNIWRVADNARCIHVCYCLLSTISVTYDSLLCTSQTHRWITF